MEFGSGSSPGYRGGWSGYHSGSGVRSRSLVGLSRIPGDEEEQDGSTG